MPIWGRYAMLAGPMLIVSSSPAHQLFTLFGVVLAAIGLIFLLVGWIISRTSRHLCGATERA